MNIKQAVKRVMVEDPFTFMLKPMAYSNRDKLVLRVENLLGKRVSPESVTRTQRKIWEEAN